jgi:hypothetical protein
MLKTIGSDMELFAKNTNEEHIALCGKIGGSKEAPKKLTKFGRGFAIQEDNVAFEFNIPASNTEQQFVNCFKTMRHEIKSILNKLDLVTSTKSSVSFDKMQLTHPNALVFGCEPDYNIWSMKENKKPQTKDENLRTAGGHIHIGSDIPFINGVRNMDLFLGVPSIIMDNNEASNTRRKLYGKAGAMRPKPYGWEYRVLSNFWMWNNELVSWVFQQSKLACQYPHKITKDEGKKIETCINTGDINLAQTICNQYKINVLA